MEQFSVHPRDAEQHAVGRALRAALLLSVLLASALLAVLAAASANTELLARHYPLLLWVNLGMALALAVLVLELTRRLIKRYRRGLFGSRLMARLAWSFTLMTVIPGLLIYLVSVQFVGRAIESWFAVPVENALRSGLSFAQTSLDALLQDLAHKARRIDLELSAVPNGQLQPILDRLRDQTGVQDALVITASGRILAASGINFATLVPDMPPAAAMRQARITRQYAAIEGGETDAASGTPGELKLRVLRQMLSPRAVEESRYLQLVHPVAPELADNAAAVQSGYRNYQELSLSREGLKRIFRVTLTLTLLLTVFTAIAAAFLLSGWLTGPLSMLARGTKAVAEGDFRPVRDYGGRDELGVLTQSFNAMTRQLDEARAQVAVNQAALEQAKAQLETVLTNLTAGVLAFDHDLRLVLANPVAERILGAELSGYHGQPLAALPRLDAQAHEILGAFESLGPGLASSWQRQVEVARGDEANAAMPRQTLLLQGSQLPAAPDAEPGYLLVFEDITDVVSAQRALAWGEVARRLAHEIKNPLTPIQLAAERLQFKLADKLGAQDAEVLRKHSQTIVNQVSAMKTMVDEFRDYSRLSPVRLEPLDLNALVADVMPLYSASGHRHAPVHARLADVLPAVEGDATQLRQLIHNLVQNAQDALEDRVDGLVEVQTRAVTDRESGRARGVRLIVRDNGPGFPPRLMARALEPYVTTKVRGTGLGLAIVKKIVDDHGARIELANRTDAQGKTAGAEVSVLFTRMAESVDNKALVETDTDAAVGDDGSDTAGDRSQGVSPAA